MSYTYLCINIACIIIPLLASFYKKYPFYKEWRYFLPVNIVVAFLFLVWDEWFTQMGVWGFNSDYLVGVYVFNLPLEEIMFFVAIPYACVFTYFVIKKYISNTIFLKMGNFPHLLLILFSFVVSVCYPDKLYTFFTAFFICLTLIYLRIIHVNINRILVSYILIMPFFFISNGMLTGSFIENPIVWYNDAENLGIRMFTIPIEDAFYGFLLILLNVVGYEKYKNRIAS